MRPVSFALTLLLCLFQAPVFTRSVKEENFFGKSIPRRYYPGEFPYKINQSNTMPLQSQSVVLSHNQVSSSASLSKITLEKVTEQIKSEGFGKSDSGVVSISFERENYNRGALSLRQSIILPAWAKCLSLWIYDTHSGMDAYLYLRNAQVRKRYLVGRVEHTGWKNFLIPIENDDPDNPLQLYDFKFLNRKQKGGFNDFSAEIKVSTLEIFSHKLSNRPLYFQMRSYTGKDFKLNFIPSQKKYAYLLQKGIFLPQKNTLSVFINLRSPLYLEIVGSRSENRNKLFLLQGPIMQRPGVYRLDIGFPEELSQYFSYQEKKGIIFWGMQVYSADNERQADFEITRVEHWEDLRIKN